MDMNQIFEMLERSGINPYDPNDISNFPTMYMQTGCKRIGPVALIQEPDVLKRVRYFNYDSTVLEFQEYCIKRGVICTGLAHRGDPTVSQILAAKMQDAWELWLLEIGALSRKELKEYKEKKPDRLIKLLETIYKRG